MIERPEDAEWPEWAEFIREAWHDLRDDRPVGFGAAGRIFFTAIDRYALRYGIAGEAFDIFKKYLRAIDGEYLKYVAERRPNQSDNGSTAKPWASL